ncbi:MAG: 16S rRNA (cytosine(967)-C(5))-methyltransferase RsmB [Porticoccaceae bacterium]
MNVRAAAAKVITQVVAKGVSLDNALPREDAVDEKPVAGKASGKRVAGKKDQVAGKKDQVAVRDLPLLSELCYGTLRWYPRLALIVDYLLDKPFKTKDTDLQALLACAVYQLSATRIPPHAAINETVAACKTLGKPWAKGLINAILRRYQREQETFDQLFAETEVYQSAHPDWLIAELRESWPDQLATIIEANNGRGPMTLRINRQHGTRDAYLDQLRAADIAAQPTALSADGVQLAAPAAVTSLPGFAEGWFSVQDEAAQLCAPLLDPRPGHRVLDACSAPGGKACHLLEYQSEIGELIALDSDAQRLLKVEENLTRLGLNANIQCADAASLDDWWDGKLFDRILLDAPCSATGVIRRHPDIKLLRKPADIAKLAAVQAELLSQLWKTLAPGGKLLYATCSVLKAENESVVSAFIESRDDVRALPFELSVEQHAGLPAGVGRQLLPTLNGHDGFYYALLEKLA